MKAYKMLKDLEFGGTLGLSGAERSNIYNLARRQQAGQSRASTDNMISAMGGRGFKAGESGIADTAIGKIQGEANERMGALSSELAANEAKLRGEQKSAEGQLRVSALSGAASAEAAEAQAAAARAAARMSQEVQLQRLDWEQEKFKDFTFPMQQQGMAWDNMFNMYGMMNKQQNTDYDRWSDMLSGA